MDGRLIAGAVALVVLGVGAFLVLDGGDDPGASPPPRKNALMKLWQVRVDAGLGLSAWPKPSRLVLNDGSGIHGHDARGGRKLWDLRAPAGAGSVCTTSPEPNDQGIGAAIFTTRRDGCALVAAFDVGSGEVLWSKRLGRDASGAAPTVAVGPTVLTVVRGCGDVRRFSARNGDALRSPRPRAADCGDKAAQTARTIVVASARRLSVYDAETATRQWSRPVVDDFELRGVIADDPLALQVEDGIEFVQTYDRTGKPSRRIGEGMKLTNGNPWIDRGGLLAAKSAVLVAGLEGEPGFSAYDLRTGERLWTYNRPGVQPLGIDDGKVLAVAGEQGTGKGLRLLSLGLRDGAARTAGAIPGSTGDIAIVPFAWDAARLYVLRRSLEGASVAAYRRRG
jgi:outer membrane protein assembly factor BamB